MSHSLDQLLLGVNNYLYSRGPPNKTWGELAPAAMWVEKLAPSKKMLHHESINWAAREAVTASTS